MKMPNVYNTVSSISRDVTRAYRGVLPSPRKTALTSTSWQRGKATQAYIQPVIHLPTFLKNIVSQFAEVFTSNALKFPETFVKSDLATA
jgi:hypothetical protein